MGDTMVVSLSQETWGGKLARSTKTLIVFISQSENITITTILLRCNINSITVKNTSTAQYYENILSY
jgi:hypothetical protein